MFSGMPTRISLSEWKDHGARGPGHHGLLPASHMVPDPGTFSESKFLYLANELVDCHEDAVEESE